jgi:tetratricopeptide (TPR) repeat protein
MRAAERASQAFAFDKAVALYETALRLAGPGASPARLTILPRLGDALSGARRAGEAGRCFVEASLTAGPERRIELERRAGEELTHAGHFDDGMTYLRRVTDALDAPISSRPWLSMLVGLVFRLRWLLLFMLRRERGPARVRHQAADEMLQRADAYWTVSAALSHVDTVAASEFSARQLLLCLQIGEPYHLSRALALEAAFLGTMGGPFLTFARHAQRVAYALVTDPPRRDALAWLAMVDAFLLFFAGDFATSMSRFEEIRRASAVEGLIDQRMYDLSILWQSIALLHRGELTDLGPRLVAWHRDAEERRDVSLTALLDGGETNTFYLLTVGHEEARSRLERARPLWLHGTFTMHHLMGGLASTSILLHEGRGAEALRAAEALRRAYRRSVIFPLIPYAQSRALYLLGCSLLAHGLEERCDDHVRRALAVSRSLARIRIPYSRIAGALLSGAANAALGRTREARAAFEEAEGRAREHGFRLHEAVARLRRAEPGGAAEGEALRVLEGQGIRDPWAAAYLLAPALRTAVVPRERSSGAAVSTDASSEQG